MSADTATQQGRDLAEQMMVDACTIGRPSLTHTTDPTTGAVSYPTTPLYSGKCRVQMMTGVRGDNLDLAGERAWVVQSAIISIPASVSGIRVGDMIHITASQMDPDLLERTYRVQDVTHKSFLTARRLICQEVTG